MNKIESLIDIVTANSEEDVDDLLTLMRPNDCPKEEIQETFEHVIGYDPTSYFDKKELSDQLESMVNIAPEDVVEQLSDNKAAILDDAYNRFDAEKSEYLEDKLSDTVYDHTGWDPSPDDDDLDLDESDEDDE